MPASFPSTAETAAAGVPDEPAARPEAPAALSGELVWAPRGPVATVALALTGLLLLKAALRGLGRIALGYKRPATVRFSERGLELSHRVELLGRVLRERETLIPFGNLDRVEREVRYARAGLYAGLSALALGTFLGSRLVVDGLRAPGGSWSLIGVGASVVCLGVALDFALSHWLDRPRGGCRLVIVPDRGKRLCLGDLAPEDADVALSRIADLAGYRSS